MSSIFLKVLDILHLNKLQIKPKKYVFGQSSISYLGFLISVKGIHGDSQLKYKEILKIKTL